MVVGTEGNNAPEEAAPSYLSAEEKQQNSPLWSPVCSSFVPPSFEGGGGGLKWGADRHLLSLVGARLVLPGFLSPLPHPPPPVTLSYIAPISVGGVKAPQPQPTTTSSSSPTTQKFVERRISLSTEGEEEKSGSKSLHFRTEPGDAVLAVDWLKGCAERPDHHHHSMATVTEQTGVRGTE